MNFDIGHATAGLLGALLAGLACRWWYTRRIEALKRAAARRDAANESASRLSDQARKQTEDLQRVLAEYRRRLSTAHASRTPKAAPAVSAAVSVSEAIDAAEAPRTMPPGGWADTQPMCSSRWEASGGGHVV